MSEDPNLRFALEFAELLLTANDDETIAPALMDYARSMFVAECEALGFIPELVLMQAALRAGS